MKIAEKFEKEIATTTPFNEREYKFMRKSAGHPLTDWLIGRIENLQNDIDEMKSAGMYRDEYIRSKANEEISELREEYREHVQTFISKYQAEIDKHRAPEVKRSAEEKLLRAQEIQTELSLMDDNAVFNLAVGVSDGKDRDRFSTRHELNLLAQEVHKRGLADPKVAKQHHMPSLIDDIQAAPEAWELKPEVKEARQAISMVSADPKTPNKVAAVLHSDDGDMAYPIDPAELVQV